MKVLVLGAGRIAPPSPAFHIPAAGWQSVAPGHAVDWMKVLVLGAGIIGVTTAQYLAADGHEVAVIDRQIGPALETSVGNAGNVCPSHATPRAAPDMRWKVLKLERYD